MTQLNCLIACSLDRPIRICRSPNRPIAQSLDRSISGRDVCLFALLADRSVAFSICLHNHLIAQLFDRLGRSAHLLRTLHVVTVRIQVVTGTGTAPWQGLQRIGFVHAGGSGGPPAD